MDAVETQVEALQIHLFAAHLAIVEAMRTGDAGTLAQANAEYERVYRECQALVGNEAKS